MTRLTPVTTCARASAAPPSAVAYAEVTASVLARASFRGAALIVPTGIEAGLAAVALRGQGPSSLKGRFLFLLLEAFGQLSGSGALLESRRRDSR